MELKQSRIRAYAESRNVVSFSIGEWRGSRYPAIMIWQLGYIGKCGKQWPARLTIMTRDNGDIADSVTFLFSEGRMLLVY